MSIRVVVVAGAAAVLAAAASAQSGTSAVDPDQASQSQALPPLVVEAPKSKKKAAAKAKKAPAATATASPTPLPPPDERMHAAQESATGPVNGLVAKQQASGTKTDTPIVEIPQTINVVTKDQIVDQKAVSLGDTLAYTPGIVVQSGAFSRMTDDFTVRGFNVAAGNGGVLRDGMKLQSNVYDGSQEPYGLERIEVLKGASSVLYGQLSPGGVINGISKRPTADPLREMNVEHGSYDRKQVSGDFSGALNADKSLLYRFTALYRDADNWVEQTPDDKVYIAPALTWRGEDTTVTFLSTYQDVDTRFSTPLAFEDVSTDRIPRDMFLGEPSFDRYEGTSYTLGYEVDHSFGGGLTLHHKARYFESDVKWDYMQSGVPVEGSELARRASKRYENSYGITTDTSLEQRFATGPFEHTVLAGFDSYRRSYDTDRFRGSNGTLNIDDPVYSGYPDVDFTNNMGFDAVGDQYGLYLQDQIKFDRWVLLLGGRQDWSQSTTDYKNGAERQDQDDDALTGRAGLVYLFDNGVAPYVSVSQSFEPQVGTDNRTGNALQPNEGLQYEAGIRYQPTALNALFTAAVYDIEQTNVTSYDAFGLSYQVGKVQSRGVELEARGQFGNVGLLAAYAYTDAEIQEDMTPGYIGQQVELVPRHAASGWVDYKLDDLGLAGVKVGAGVRYIGETNLLDLPDKVPSYVLVDAMARFDLGTISKDLARTEFTLNARNLFDKDFYTCAGATGCRYGEPLTVTGTLSYKW